MDMSDFTSAENKKMTTENDIPTFNPPIGDAPKVGVDGKSTDTQQPTQDDAAAPAAPQPLDEAEGEKAEESDVDRSFDEILKIFSRGDKF